MTWAIYINNHFIGGQVHYMMEELNGHEEAFVIFPNTANMRTLISEDQVVTIKYVGATIFEGTLAGIEYTPKHLKCRIYNTVYYKMDKRQITVVYDTPTPGTTILTAIAAEVSGVSAGICPTTPIGIRFNKSSCFEAAKYLAKSLNRDFYSTLGTTFNIATNAPNTTNLVLHLPFDEGAGAITEDFSGEDNDGAITGASWTSATFGTALSFDGDNDIVTVPDDDTLDISADMTILFKINIHTGKLASIKGIISKSDAYILRSQNGGAGLQLYLYGRDDGGGDFEVVSSQTYLAEDEDHVIAVVVSGNSVLFYRDGVLLDTKTLTGTTDISGSDLIIGQAWGNYIAADIDEVCIYSRALSAADVKAHYNLTTTRGTAWGTIPHISISRRAIDRYKKRDKVYVRGVDPDGVELTGSAGTGNDVATFTERKASNQTALDNLAAYYLAQLNKDSSGIRVIVSIVYGFNMSPGDTITISNEELNLNGSYRIWRITKRVETVDLEIDVAEGLLERYLENQQNLEDLGIYPISPDQLDNPPGAPAVPAGLTTENGPLAIKLTWTPNTEADFLRYHLYRHTSDASGSSSKLSEIDASYFTDRILYGDAETYYYYWLRGEDRVGNVSAFTSGATPSGYGKLIHTADISNSAIVTAKILDYNITGPKIVGSAIQSTHIVTNAIIARTVAASQIQAGHIVTDAVRARTINAGAITTTKLDAYCVTAGKIEASAVTAVKLAANSVTAQKIVAQAVSIGKLATDINNRFVQVYHTKFGFAVSTGVIDKGDWDHIDRVWGNNAVYTREILSEDTIHYRIRDVLCELKTTKGNAASQQVTFCDVRVEWGGVEPSRAAICKDAGAPTDWGDWLTVSGIGAGAKDFVIQTTNDLQPIARGVPVGAGVGTVAWGPAHLESNSGGSYTHCKLYSNYASANWQINDFSSYDGLLMSLHNEWAQTLTLRIRISSDTGETNSLYFDVELDQDEHWCGMTLFSAMTETGTMDLSSIQKFSIETITEITVTDVSNILSMGFFAVATEGYIPMEVTTQTSYTETSHAVNILGALNTTMELVFHLGGSTDDTYGDDIHFIQEPSSDVRGISYLEAT